MEKSRTKPETDHPKDPDVETEDLAELLADLITDRGQYPDCAMAFTFNRPEELTGPSMKNAQEFARKLKLKIHSLCMTNLMEYLRPMSQKERNELFNGGIRLVATSQKM
jgi:hypothetical protein